MRIFLRLKAGYGDCAAFRIVVAHYRKLYPDAWIKVDSPLGTQCFYTDLADDTQPYSYPFTRWDAEGKPYDIAEYVIWNHAQRCWLDYPSSKVTVYLIAHNIEPDLSLFNYDCVGDDEAWEECSNYVEGLRNGTKGVVCIHYEGTHRPEQKNLDHFNMSQVVAHLIREGYCPLILDFHKTSPIVDNLSNAFCPYYLLAPEPYRCQTTASIIANCDAFFGIASAPSVLAGATHTPSWVVWTEQHPNHYFDPCDNVTHLVPYDHAQYLPEINRDDGLTFFGDAFHFQPYGNWADTLCEIIDSWGVAKSQQKWDGMWD